MMHAGGQSQQEEDVAGGPSQKEPEENASDPSQQDDTWGDDPQALPAQRKYGYGRRRRKKSIERGSPG